VDPMVALVAAERSGWLPGEPLRTVLRLLRGPRTEWGSALGVSSGFVHELWSRSIPISGKHQILFALLDALASGRDRRQVFASLARQLAFVFRSRQYEYQHLAYLIDFWGSFKSAVI